MLKRSAGLKNSRNGQWQRLALAWSPKFPQLIMWCVRWYRRYPISVAQMGEMTRERGLAIRWTAGCSELT